MNEATGWIGGNDQINPAYTVSPSAMKIVVAILADCGTVPPLVDRRSSQ
jgi:hypothetical protein